ncbi:MAG: outer membrane beta-barrel protein [Calditrichaeota bacterium]|nr:outer membrane beta-barrel protein [Calditrichota bacterium]
MTVEVEQTKLKVPMADMVEGRGGTQSRRLFLTGRYGLQDFADAFVRLGAASLDFDEFGNGFSAFSSSPSFAWGAGMRVGFAISEKLEVNANVSYLGFKAEGEVTRSGRKISNRYLWQEIAPAMTIGYRVSEVTPYVGVGKTYLTGQRDFDVSYNGEQLALASGSESYSDSEQPISPIVGLEWHLPDGYSLTGEATGADGDWSVSIGLSQALR